MGFDGEVLSKAIVNLLARKRKNEELRAQFCEKPEKFEESEIELHTAVSKLNSLSAYPELIKEFTESGAPKALLELLLHENTDIATDVINFFHEILTADLDPNNLERVLELQQKLVTHKFFQGLLSNLQRLDENNSDEYDSVHKILGNIKKEEVAK